MTSHQTLRESLGVLALQRLPADEAEPVRRHLETCPECRAELAQLSPLAPLLTEVRADHVDPAAEPPPELAEAVMARVERERNAAAHPERPRATRRWVAALAAAVAVVALAFGLGWMVKPVPEPPPITASVGLQQAPNETASGAADLIDQPTGTEIVMRVQGLTKGQLYRVEIVTKDAVRIPAGGLMGTGNELSTARFNVGVAMSDTASLEVLDPAGNRVLWSVWA